MIGYRFRQAGSRCRLAMAVTLSLTLLLTACGGGGSHHTTSAGSSGDGGSEAPTFATGGAPGLRLLKLTLPEASVELTPRTDTPGTQPGHDKLSHEIVTAPAATVIHLASGRYPKFEVTKRRTGWVTVSGEGDVTKPVLLGAKLFGASHIRFVDVDLSKIRMNQSPIPKYAHPTTDVQVLNSEIDCNHHGGGVGVTVRNGARHITFDGDFVHNCQVGFASDAQDIVSNDVSITHCLFENFYDDAIDLGAMHDLTIADDVVRLIAHKHHHPYHDDGIQFFGNTSNTLIEHNVLANSNDQLIFIQDAIKSIHTRSSVNADIAVIGNLIYGAGAIAVQDQGCVDCQFVGNTIWATHDGAILIRKSGYTGIVPTHTLIADNIFQQYTLAIHGHVVQGYNVFARSSGSKGNHGPHDVVTAKVDLQSPRQGLFAPTGSSPATGSAAPQAVLLRMARAADADPGVISLLARYRAPDRGAVASGSKQPSYGVPYLVTGHKLRGGLLRRPIGSAANSASNAIGSSGKHAQKRRAGS